MVHGREKKEGIDLRVQLKAKKKNKTAANLSAFTQKRVWWPLFFFNFQADAFARRALAQRRRLEALIDVGFGIAVYRRP